SGISRWSDRLARITNEPSFVTPRFAAPRPRRDARSGRAATGDGARPGAAAGAHASQRAAARRNRRTDIRSRVRDVSRDRRHRLAGARRGLPPAPAATARPARLYRLVDEK